MRCLKYVIGNRSLMGERPQKNTDESLISIILNVLDRQRSQHVCSSKIRSIKAAGKTGGSALLEVHLK